MDGDIRTFTVDAMASRHGSVPLKQLLQRWLSQLGQSLQTFPFALISSVSLGASVFLGISASTALDIIALGLLLTSTTVLIVVLAVTKPSIIRQMLATGSAQGSQPEKQAGLGGWFVRR